MVLIIWEGETFGSDVMLQLIEDLFNAKFNSPLSMMNLFDTPFSNFLHFWLKGAGRKFYDRCAVQCTAIYLKMG